ncbi:acyltransferase family protein [Azospirillum sp. sgz301742]
MVYSPFLALALTVVAVGASALILRAVPAAARPLASADAGRFAAIDGLRGLLAYGVFIHHGVITWQYLHTGQWALPPSRLYTHLGQSTVGLFFMVTSFLFWSKVLNAGPRIDWLGLLISRIYRLYPVYGLTFVSAVTLALTTTGFGLKVDAAELARSLLGWATFKTPALNGMANAGQIVAYATWSLPYEVLFYGALPALAFLFSPARRLWPALASLGAVVAILLYFRGFDRAVLVCFLGGFAAAYGVRRPGLLRLARSTLGGAVALAALLGTVAGFPGAYGPLPVLGLGVFFAAVAAGQDFGGLLTRRPILWMGDISYGVYLLHGIVLWVLITGNAPLRAAVLENEPLFALAFAGAGILVVALASLVHLMVERPAIARGRENHALLQAARARRVPA